MYYVPIRCIVLNLLVPCKRVNWCAISKNFVCGTELTIDSKWCNTVFVYVMCVRDDIIESEWLTAEVKTLAGDLLNSWMAIFREGQSGK